MVMKVKISSVHFDADQKLLNFIEEKVGKLETFYDKIIDSSVVLKIDKSSDKENKLAEIKLAVPGKDLFAKKQCKTFEEAVDEAVEALRRQVRKQKTKENAIE
ncbi:MAG: ribosomal subunit interface protein [Bacteroidota bacterium]|jgi:putative sigma-54 modulation protein